jgi:1-acyl-sn-glycerol-3-phosphate acyltransferase
VEVEGGGGIRKGEPYIFAANHQSQFDIPVLAGFLQEDFCWMAKKELFQIPVFGRSMRATGFIPVDRSHGRQAMQSLLEAAKRIAAGTSVILFPEGTRSRDGRLQEFKSGAMVLAIKAGVPLVPVAIIGTHKILPKGKLLVQPGEVLVRVGEPIDTKTYGTKQKHELAQRLQKEVALLMALDLGHKV